MMSDLITSCQTGSDLVFLNFCNKLRNTNFNFYQNSLIFLNLGICCHIKNCPALFCLIYTFWHHCGNSFQLKMLLLNLGYIKIFWWKFCIWRPINGCCPRTNESELTFLVIDGTRHWLSISYHLLNDIKWKDVSAQTTGWINYFLQKTIFPLV